MIVKIFNGKSYIINKNIDTIFNLKKELSEIINRSEYDINILSNGKLQNDNLFINKCMYYDVVLKDSFNGNKVSFITI